MEKQKTRINEKRKKMRCSDDGVNLTLKYANNVIKKRSCLMCGKMFKSKGPCNRRCAKCARLIEARNKDSFYTCSEYKTLFSESDMSDISDSDIND